MSLFSHSIHFSLLAPYRLLQMDKRKKYKEGDEIDISDLKGFKLIEENKIRNKRRRGDDEGDAEPSCRCKQEGRCCADDSCVYRASKEVRARAVLQCFCP